MLIAQGGEPVVGGDEQVVAGDSGLVVERRPVRLHLPGIRLPAQLLLMGKGTPRLQRSLMHGRHLHLTGRSGKGGRYPLPEEAFTSSVICSKRPGGAEGVIDKYVGVKPGHKS